MSIANLSSILNIFKGKSHEPQNDQQLFKEVLLMTLARASHADSNVSKVEINTIQSAIKQVTGDDVEASEIRVAAGSELYEAAPLETYLGRVRDRLNVGNRVAIVRSLADVIRSDCEITSMEISFFNRVSEALRVTPAELAGLTQKQA